MSLISQDDFSMRFWKIFMHFKDTTRNVIGVDGLMTFVECPIQKTIGNGETGGCC